MDHRRHFVLLLVLGIAACNAEVGGGGGVGGAAGSPSGNAGSTGTAGSVGAAGSTGAANDGGAAPTVDGGPSQDAAAGNADARPSDAPAPTMMTPNPPSSGPGVLTQHNDVMRTGANLGERTLTPANVNMRTFGKLYCRAVDDELYAQLLYLPDADVGGGVRRDLVFAATTNNSVYAFDANDRMAPAVWQRRMGEPPNTGDLSDGTCGFRSFNPNAGNAYRDFARNMGIVSTPVIDPATRTMYLVARLKDPTLTGAQRFSFKLHALDVVTGQDRAGSPVTITATYPGTGAGSTGGMLTFDPWIHNQRASLLLSGGMVFVGFSSHCDFGAYHGWLMAYDAQNLQRKATYVTTPNGWAGGIWMSGQGPSVDEQGQLFFSTGNGDVTANAATPNRGNSVIKLRFDGTAGAFSVTDWFTPATWQLLNQRDNDFGSGGVLLIPGGKYAVTGGKDGRLYLLDRTNLGKVAAGDMQIPQSITLTPNQGHIHGAPVYWKRANGDEFIYVMAEEDYLRQLLLENGRLTLFRESNVKAPDETAFFGRFTMPGGILSISADGGGNGIVWLTTTVTGNANQAVVPGVMRAFDANDVSRELWNSLENKTRDDFGNFAKYTPPTVFRGKVFVPTFSKQFCVYGSL